MEIKRRKRLDSHPFECFNTLRFNDTFFDTSEYNLERELEEDPPAEGQAGWGVVFGALLFCLQVFRITNKLGSLTIWIVDPVV